MVARFQVIGRGLLLLVAFGLLLGVSFFLNEPVAAAPDLTEKSFKEITDYFKTTADTKGALVAYEELRRAKLPPGTDLHLLGHTVGDELYKQKGMSGIADCTPEFRNACSHTIVVGALLERGETALTDIRDACRKAPGGSGAYTMCYHGLGHGVLAFVNYEMPQAVELCRKVGTPEYRDREYIECVGGAVMEMVDGGIHDKGTWAEKAPIYAPVSDPLAPCNASYMPAAVQGICYSYLTPRLWGFTDGVIRTPDEAAMITGFHRCEQLPADSSNRSACSGGFGKEFVGLANGRDYRTVNSMGPEQFATIYRWCSFANVESDLGACLSSALASIFWGGENDPNVARNFCASIPDTLRAEQCFRELVGNINNYLPKDLNRLCTTFPEEYRYLCGGTRELL